MTRWLVTTLVAVVVSVGLMASASALTLIDCDRAGVSDEQCQSVSDDRLDYKGDSSLVWQGVQLFLGILGGVAVIVIIVGGIKYATSQGDSAGVSSAKNTIMYAIIGLVVALAASGIVALVRTILFKQ